jgi:hypothetical protein
VVEGGRSPCEFEIMQIPPGRENNGGVVMKVYTVLLAALAAAATTALGVATNYYQIGGDISVRDQGWNQNTVTNSGVTPTEYSWSFGAPEIYPDLSNMVITVTAVETNDIMFIQSTHLAGTNGNSGRLDGDEAILLTVSYEDPDGLLLGLKVDSFGPWWNTGADEQTLFSDGTAVYAMQDTDNGVMADYDTTGLTQLTLGNTETWSMLVYQTNNLTTSGLGGFKLEYIADVDAVVTPPEPPYGEVELNATWSKSRCVILAEGTDFCSAIFTNNVAGENNVNRRFFQDGFASAPVQVGETLNISFTAVVGTNLPITGADRIFRASFWDSGATAANGFSFRADYGAIGGTTLQAGLGNVQSPGYVGSLDTSVSTVDEPTNGLVNQGDQADFVITIKRTGETTADFTMSYDDIALTNSFIGVNNFDSLDAVGFRMNSVEDNHLIITNLQIEVVGDGAFDWYGYWAFYALLEEGVNDGFTQDPDEDGMVNLLEYGFDGDPLTADAWRQPQFGGLSDDGVSFIYRRRRDAADRGLSYFVGAGPDLMTAGRTNATVEAGTEVINSSMEFVTNRVSTAAEQQFMQLRITQE